MDCFLNYKTRKTEIHHQNGQFSQQKIRKNCLGAKVDSIAIEHFQQPDRLEPDEILV